MTQQFGAQKKVGRNLINHSIHLNASRPVDAQPTINAQVANIQRKIGARVFSRRKSLKLTIMQLSMTSGISAGMISKVEHGTISPSLSTLYSLAKALNVSIHRFFVDAEDG
jgi:ribosome-binding protein aMBF1 (putative translation factor)